MFQATGSELSAIISGKTAESEIARSTGNSDEYRALVEMLPQIEEGARSGDRVRALKSMRMLAELFRYKAIPDECSDPAMFVALLSAVTPLMDEELMEAFGCAVANYHSHEIFDPAPEIVQFASEVFMRADSAQCGVLKPYLQFLSYASKCVRVEMMESDEFYGKLRELIGVSQEMDRNVAYLLSSALEMEMPTSVLVLVPGLVDALWKSKFELLEDTLIDMVRIVYLVIYWFDDDEIVKLKEYYEMLLSPLKSLWNQSVSISISILLIVQLPIPNEYVQMLLDSGGREFMLNAIKEKNSAISEALYLLAKLIKNGDDYEYMFPEVMRNAYFGKINTRIAAGMCIASYIYYNYELVYPSFLEVMDEDDELNVANAISIILDFNNCEVNEALIKALYHLSFKFYERRQVHEFRETCDQYYIPEKINSIIDNPDVSDSLIDAGELFIYTSIRGIISFNEMGKI